MCISPSTLVDILARALQRGNLRGFTEIRERVLVGAGEMLLFPLSSLLPPFMSHLKGETGLIWEKAEACCRVEDVRRSSGTAVILSRDWCRPRTTWKSFCCDFFFFFCSDLGLMCYSWSTSFWLQRLPFNHHTDDVFAEVLLIVKCVYVSSLLVYEERVQVSYLIFPCAIFVRIRALIKDGTKKKCCWCRVSAGVCAGCFVKKKGEKL